MKAKACIATCFLCAFIHLAFGAGEQATMLVAAALIILGLCKDEDLS